MIPQYGELNRIYSDFIVSHTFSFDKQKFITNFYKQYNDTKAFEAAILELVLDKQKEQYTLILDSLRAEIEKNMMLYEKYPLLDDEIISRVCYHFADRYNIDIEEQLEVTQKLNKPLNEAYNRYDSIDYREHTAEEEKQAEKEYERCKAEYEKEKEELDKLYELQKQARKEAFQYIENCCGDIYKLSFHFMEILAKYIPVAKDKPEELTKPSEPDMQEEAPKEEQHEYFDMELLSHVYTTCVGEQFENISEYDFYACMNLHPGKCKLKIKTREKIRVCYLIFLMGEQLPKLDRENWKKNILKMLDIEENYYKSKYKEPVSDFPSDSNQKFAKEMDLQELLSKPVWQMTGEEFIFLSKHASRQTETQPQPITDTERKYVYGILGIAKLFGCSLPTANRIKKSGKIDKAITQIGRKIIVDVELALELAGKKTGGRK